MRLFGLLLAAATAGAGCIQNSTSCDCTFPRLNIQVVDKESGATVYSPGFAELGEELMTTFASTSTGAVCDENGTGPDAGAVDAGSAVDGGTPLCAWVFPICFPGSNDCLQPAAHHIIVSASGYESNEVDVVIQQASDDCGCLGISGSSSPSVVPGSTSDGILETVELAHQ